jgi:hypothetical protein
MTYTVGGLIQASDYNGFANNTPNANVNNVWGVGAGDAGYGQSTILSTVAQASVVTATNWASLNSRITSLANQTGTAITSRASPSAGNTITILAALNTDLTNCTTNRGNAALTGSQFTAWTGTSSKTTSTGSGSAAWTITFTHTISWASANAARYFFNAGGRIKWETSKTSTGTSNDTSWNNLANTIVGDIFITGGTSTQTIASVPYTGTTISGGSGTPAVLLTTTGWYDLTVTDTLIYQQYDVGAPYSGQYIAINAKTAASGTQLVLTTTWVDPGGGFSDDISGGTATTGISFGTAPATIVTYYPPSTTYLTSTWGVPTVASTTA